MAVNCQTDESADIGIKENLPTEGIDAQSQARAREIVNSEEYENAMNQMEMFISKVNDEHFFTGELFNVEKQTYNYNVINERLSMTSFKSAEEFIQEYEKMFYSIQELVKRNPNFTDPFLQEKIEEELDNQYYDKPERSSIGSCLSLCNQRNISCIRYAGNVAIAQLAACGITGVIIPAVAPIVWGVCGSAAVVNYWISKNHCWDNYYYCKQGCYN